MGRMCVFPRNSPAASGIVGSGEKTDLGRIARRQRQAQMGKSRSGKEPSARRTLHESLLQKIGLYDFFDRVARLAECRCDGLNTDRSAGISVGDQAQIAPVEG